MGNGEIARYEQFLLFPQCFQKACFPGASKGVVVWEWVKLFIVIGAYLQGLKLTFLLLAKNCECHDFQLAKCKLLLAK